MTGRSGAAWRSLIGLAGLFTLPLVYNVLTLPAEDRRSQLVLAWFVLPERMLIKLDLDGRVRPFRRSRGADRGAATSDLPAGSDGCCFSRSGRASAGSAPRASGGR